MSEKMTAKNYLELLKKSQVIPAEILGPALKRLSQSEAGKPISLQRLTEFLLAEGLLTPWQNDQLLQGRHKGFFLGQYRLLRLLGSGGMSAVYLAEHKIAKNLRAIKVLPKSRAADKSYLDRFYVEGRAAAALKHPNVAQIADLASEGDLHYMVMEFVEGTDLDRLVKDEGPLDVLTALNYLAQATDALRHAHSRNIIHRDIKPANLMVSHDRNTIKLLDLGLALMRDAESSLTVLHNERVMGTADYLSPEQAIDSHKVDQRTDIYSLGCTFYFMLAGHPPFPEGTIAQRIAKHQTAEPADLTSMRDDCPVPVWRLCQKMMRKNPNDRFQDCQQLYDAVHKAIALLTLDTKVKAEPLTTPNAEEMTQVLPLKASEKPEAATPLSPPASKPAVAQTPRGPGGTPGDSSAGPTQRDASPLAKSPSGPQPITQPAGNAHPAVAAIASIATPTKQPVAPAAVPRAPSDQPSPPKTATEKPQPVPPDLAGTGAKSNKKRGDPKFLDFVSLAELDQGSRTDLSQLRVDASSAAPLLNAPKTTRDKRSSLKAYLIFGGIIAVMFTILIVVLYFLNRYLS